jgi:NADH-quinone oxidoreductase subunit F
MLTVAGEQSHEQVLAPVVEDDAIAALRGEIVAPAAAATVPQQGEPGLRLLHRIGVVDPRSLHDYRANGGYDALRRAFKLGPQGVIREVKDSGLMGRGGAAFPCGVKWEAVAQQPVEPHYLVCNADESEPGTFKDRVVMLGDPYAVVESMTIAAFATHCTHGYLYLRGEYPDALATLEDALAMARRHGYLGDDILGSGFSFDIEIRRGAGAYICGEETAIFNSIEGFRGEPRAKPPFPVVRGLFGKPTVVNNIETLINVPAILLEGGPAFARIGTEKSTGPKLFCLSGHVARPGVYEVPFGETLGELLERAGGVPGGRELQAVMLGGAAGFFVGPGDLGIPLTFEGAREAGVTLGSGVVCVFDETVDVGRMLMRIAAFFRDESCGQCTPCRVGTVRQEEALARLLSGHVRGSVADELALLGDVGTCMRDSSICGMGQTAAGAIMSAIERLEVFQ